MTNKKLQELLKQHPDDMTIILSRGVKSKLYGVLKSLRIEYMQGKPSDTVKPDTFIILSE